MNLVKLVCKLKENKKLYIKNPNSFQHIIYIILKMVPLFNNLHLLWTKMKKQKDLIQILLMDQIWLFLKKL